MEIEDNKGDTGKMILSVKRAEEHITPHLGVKVGQTKITRWEKSFSDVEIKNLGHKKPLNNKLTCTLVTPNLVLFQGNQLKEQIK